MANDDISPEDNSIPPNPPVGLIANLADPILLKDLNLTGVTAAAGRQGDQIPIWQRLALTSDDPHFHRIAEGLVNFIGQAAQAAGHVIDTALANDLLLVMHEDNSGRLWVDSAAKIILAVAKRPVVAGQPVFQSDLGDIIEMRFPAVDLKPTDRLLYIFRNDWRFGLFFDLRTDADLEVEQVGRALGSLFRIMAYRHHYDAVRNEQTFSRLVSAGWFPFVEIIGDEFRSLLNLCEAQFPLDDAEAALLQSFDEQRIAHIGDRWFVKPQLGKREKILRSAIRAFLNEDPVACLKIILTEIEGVLADAYQKETGTSTRRIGKLLSFAAEAGERRAGNNGTLLFPIEFGRYLETYTYAGFDPSAVSADAGSRNVVGHGVANDDDYTQVRALQAILTLDQLLFYF